MRVVEQPAPVNERIGLQRVSASGSHTSQFSRNLTPFAGILAAYGAGRKKNGADQLLRLDPSCSRALEQIACGLHGRLHVGKGSNFRNDLQVTHDIVLVGDDDRTRQQTKRLDQQAVAIAEGSVLVV